MSGLFNYPHLISYLLLLLLFLIYSILLFTNINAYHFFIFSLFFFFFKPQVFKIAHHRQISNRIVQLYISLVSFFLLQSSSVPEKKKTLGFVFNFFEPLHDRKRLIKREPQKETSRFANID